MKKTIKLFSMFLILTLSVVFTGCGSSDDVIADLTSNPVIAAISGNLSGTGLAAPAKAPKNDVAITPIFMNGATVKLFFGGAELGSVTTDTNGFFKFQIKALDLAAMPALLTLI